MNYLTNIVFTTLMTYVLSFSTTDQMLFDSLDEVLSNMSMPENYTDLVTNFQSSGFTNYRLEHASVEVFEEFLDNTFNSLHWNMSDDDVRREYIALSYASNVTLVKSHGDTVQDDQGLHVHYDQTRMFKQVNTDESVSFSTWQFNYTADATRDLTTNETAVAINVVGNMSLHALFNVLYGNYTSHQDT